MTITLRRFRLVKKAAATASRRQYVLNIHLGKLRQINLEYRHPSRHKHKRRDTHRLQTALASLLIICGISGITFSAAALARPRELPPTKTFTSESKPSVTAQPTVKQSKTLVKSTPTHITIASQQIDVDLVPVGLAADGSIELPPVLDWVAGWYNYSPTPGEIGPSVIVGHVDSYEGPSVFWRLRDVHAGDIVNINREDGSVAQFKIIQLAEYDQNNFPTETVYGNTQTAQLRIITCSGTFDTTTQHYTQNTVVYAELL